MAVFVCLLGQQTHMPGVGNTKRRWKNCWGTDRPILVEHARLLWSTERIDRNVGPLLSQMLQ